MIELPDKKKCYNLPEQVAQNLRNITFLAEQYKNIDALPAIWKTYKEEFDSELETFGEWTTTFEGWTESLSTYLANMSSAAVGAIAGQNIAPANVAATGNITAPSIIENMSGYIFTKRTDEFNWTPVYVGVVKNGNKLTFCIFGRFTYGGESYGNIANIVVPAAVANKLFPVTVGGIATVLENKGLDFLDTSALGDLTRCSVLVQKYDALITFQLRSLTALTSGHEYLFRIEQTFLLSDNLAA